MIEPSQSKWLPSPISEKAIVEDLDSERRHRRGMALMIVASVSACLLGCLSILNWYDPEGKPMSLGVLALPLAIFFAGTVRVGLGRRDRHRRHRALHAEYENTPGWLVEITIHQGEATTGRDVGLLWLEDDRLFFTGARTSFALGPGDIDPKPGASDALLDRWMHGVLRLRADSAVGPVHLGLLFLKDERPYRGFEGVEANFARRFKPWIRQGGHARGQLPPLSLGPDLPSLAMLKRRAILATGVWVGLGLSALGIALPDGDSVKLFSAMGGGALIVIVAFWPAAAKPRRCWRAIQDRNRLDASQ